jgi:hypothetical protein
MSEITMQGAHGGAELIKKRYLGEIEENKTIDEIESCCDFVGGDFAFELRGAKLHIFRIIAGVRA